MAKRLYCVRVLMYVMAENQSDACVAATRAHFDIFECNARKADRIHPVWQDAIPYNADDERTCAEIRASELAIQAPPAFVAPRVRPGTALRSLRLPVAASPG